ncbi:MAG: hypothetical protein J6U04_02110 [Salinivirgaceae bacterium]|nr:hypothetical protein [Salinivirgaceae bacterium]
MFPITPFVRILAAPIKSIAFVSHFAGVRRRRPLSGKRHCQFFVAGFPSQYPKIRVSGIAEAQKKVFLGA